MEVFMCLIYKQGRKLAISLPRFFINWNNALNYALNEAKLITIQPHWSPFENGIKEIGISVKIFKIPFNTDVCVNDYGGENYIKTVYDPKTTKVMLIQKQWRKIYNTRWVSAWIIKHHIRRAMANPNTQLCKNRLHHEFYDMV